MSSMHSTLWPDLITFDERIRSLENSLKAASAGSEQTSPATMHQDSALVILDLVDIPNWGLGYEAGRKLTRTLRQMVLDQLEAGLTETTEPPVLSKLFLVLIANTEGFHDEQLSKAQDFMLGFNKPRRSALTFGVMVHSAEAHTNKIKDVLRLFQPALGLRHLVLSCGISEGSNSLPKHHKLDLWKLTAEGSLNLEAVATSERVKDMAKTKPLNPDLSVFRQSPAVCNNEYLLPDGCLNEDCRFAHDYALTPEDIKQLAEAVKGLPCSSVKGDQIEECPQGPDCVYGHVCPRDQHCMKDRCNFGAAAHPRRNAAFWAGASRNRAFTNFRTRGNWRGPKGGQRGDNTRRRVAESPLQGPSDSANDWLASVGASMEARPPIEDAQDSIDQASESATQVQRVDEVAQQAPSVDISRKVDEHDEKEKAGLENDSAGQTTASPARKVENANDEALGVTPSAVEAPAEAFSGKKQARTSSEADEAVSSQAAESQVVVEVAGGEADQSAEVHEADEGSEKVEA